MDLSSEQTAVNTAGYQSPTRKSEYSYFSLIKRNGPALYTRAYLKSVLSTLRQHLGCELLVGGDQLPSPPSLYTSYRGGPWLHGLQETWDKAEDALILPMSISMKKGNTFWPLSLQASWSLVSRSRKQNAVPTALSAPMISWLLSVLTLSSHRTPPKSECPAASHTRETGSEQAAGMELHHPGHQSPQGSSPLSSASLSCTHTQGCHGPGC